MKRILGIIIPLLTCVAIFGQNNADIYRVTYLKPKAGGMDELLAGMKEHNKKHHNKGIMKVRTYRVISGEKSGWLVRTYGPMTWVELDKFSEDSNSKAHRAHGAKVLRPYIGESTGPMYWTPMENLHYNPSASDKASCAILKKEELLNFLHQRQRILIVRFEIAKISQQGIIDTNHQIPL